MVPRGRLQSGHRPPVHLAQANCSVSSAGTLRGIHFAQLPPSQAKFVTCVHGAAFDVVVDLRAGSPTFGQWDAVLLDARDRRAVYLPEGLGHAFMALEDDTVVTYLCSTPHAPDREHGIHPLDPQIGIEWPTESPTGEAISRVCLPRTTWRPRSPKCRNGPAGDLRGLLGLRTLIVRARREPSAAPTRTGWRGTTRPCRPGPARTAPAARSRAHC